MQSNYRTHNRGMNTSFQTALTLDAIRQIAPSAFAASAHASRSSRYTFIPTSDVIAGLMAQGFAPFQAAQSRSRIEGKQEFTKHMIRFRHADSLATRGTGAVPEVVLINAHDGSARYKLFGGVFSVVCANGLIVADTLVNSLSVHHKGNIVDSVIEGSFEIINQTRETLGRVDEFRQLRLSDGEQNAFADAARSLRFANSDGMIETPITAAQLLAPRRREEMDATATSWTRPAHDLWNTLNVVQENVIRGGLTSTHVSRDEDGRTTRRRMSTREVKGIDQDVKLNRALWMLAERMAELKGAAVAA